MKTFFYAGGLASAQLPNRGAGKIPESDFLLGAHGEHGALRGGVPLREAQPSVAARGMPGPRQRFQIFPGAGYGDFPLCWKASAGARGFCSVVKTY